VRPPGETLSSAPTSAAAASTRAFARVARVNAASVQKLPVPDEGGPAHSLLHLSQSTAHTPGPTAHSGLLRCSLTRRAKPNPNPNPDPDPDSDPNPNPKPKPKLNPNPNPRRSASLPSWPCTRDRSQRGWTRVRVRVWVRVTVRVRDSLTLTDPNPSPSPSPNPNQVAERLGHSERSVPRPAAEIRTPIPTPKPTPHPKPTPPPHRHHVRAISTLGGETQDGAEIVHTWFEAT